MSSASAQRGLARYGLLSTAPLSASRRPGGIPSYPQAHFSDCRTATGSLLSASDPGSGEAYVDVQLAGLKDLASVMRAELDGSVRPGVGELLRVYGLGVRFGPGWLRSAEVRDARERYGQCLSAASQTLATQVRAAEAMV